jgi:uncharacterized protein YneF (UPF0154 family)
MRYWLTVLAKFVTVIAMMAGIFVVLSMGAFWITYFLLDASPSESPGTDLGASISFVGMLFVALVVSVYGGFFLAAKLFALEPSPSPNES